MIYIRKDEEATNSGFRAFCKIGSRWFFRRRGQRLEHFSEELSDATCSESHPGLPYHGNNSCSPYTILQPFHLRLFKIQFSENLRTFQLKAGSGTEKLPFSDSQS